MSGQPGDLRRADWKVEPIPHPVAAAFLIQYHYSRSTPNTGRCFGLLSAGFQLGLDLAGASLWIPPTRTAAEAIAGDEWRGVLACSRLACSPDAPRNAASYLLAASMRMIDRERWPVLLTYADTGQGHTGSIYRATGWSCDGPVPAGDVWENDQGELRGRKRGGRTLLADEMRLAGYRRRPQLPKIRFVHRAGYVAHG